MEDYERLLREVNEVIAPYNCEVVGFTPNTVGIKGDDRVYGPGVIIKIPEGLSHEEIEEISTEITNRVRDITRVLIDIPPVA